jgi:hypothetical protein
MSDVVAVALISGGFAIIVAMINRIHKQINSRMDDLLRLTEESSHAKGMKDQRDAEGPAE